MLFYLDWYYQAFEHELVTLFGLLFVNDWTYMGFLFYKFVSLDEFGELFDELDINLDDWILWLYFVNLICRYVCVYNIYIYIYIYIWRIYDVIRVDPLSTPVEPIDPWPPTSAESSPGPRLQTSLFTPFYCGGPQQNQAPPGVLPSRNLPKWAWYLHFQKYPLDKLYHLHPFSVKLVPVIIFSFYSLK